MTQGLMLIAGCALVATTLLSGGAPLLPVISGLALGAVAVAVHLRRRPRSTR
jgi:hypothetical protein